MTTRRGFLMGAGLAGAALVSSGARSLADEAVIAVESGSVREGGPSGGLGLDARILALGNLGYFRPDLKSQDVLSVLDLRDGTWLASATGTAGGHLAQPLVAGGAVLIPRNGNTIEIRDFSLAKGRVITAVGYGFSGHCIERDGELILGAERKSDGLGVLLRVSVDSGKLVGESVSGGVHPHDMVRIAKDRIAVSHYGLTYEAQHGEGGGAARFMFEGAKPVITIVDLKTFAVIKTIAIPGNFAATHLAFNGGTVWMMPLQYRLLTSQDAAGEVVPAGIALRQDEWKALRVAEGLPIISLDPATGALEAFDLGWNDQRRGQSIASDAATGKIFGAFPYSDTVWVHDPATRQTVARRAFDFGIHAVRGVASIGDSGLVAISGEWEGISVVDAKSLKLVARYAMPTFWTTHIGVQTV